MRIQVEINPHMVSIAPSYLLQAPPRLLQMVVVMKKRGWYRALKVYFDLSAPIDTVIDFGTRPINRNMISYQNQPVASTPIVDPIYTSTESTTVTSVLYIETHPDAECRIKRIVTLFEQDLTGNISVPPLIETAPDIQLLPRNDSSTAKTLPSTVTTPKIVETSKSTF